MAMVPTIAPKRPVPKKIASFVARFQSAQVRMNRISGWYQHSDPDEAATDDVAHLPMQ